MPESIYDIEETFGPLPENFPDKPIFVSCFGGGTAEEVGHIRRGVSKLGIPCYPPPERVLRSFRP